MSCKASRNLTSLLLDRVSESPGKLLFSYLGETPGPTELSYSGLLDAALGVAARLDPSRIRGERVLLLFPPGLEFLGAFMGCAMSGAIAVPAPPPNPLKPKRSLERLTTILQSARPVAALTTRGVLEILRPALAELPEFGSLRWIAVDEPVDGGLALPEPIDPDPSEIVLIQYTSGSTSDPKGAALDHANIVENLAYCDDGWRHEPDTVQVNWLPAFHDLGLIYGLLTPIHLGFRTVVMSPIDVIQRPFSWLDAISRHRGTHSGGPNFIYELCARKVRPAEAETLDLSSWRMAMTAAEPIRTETMERFASRFGPQGFRWRAFCPGYGLSEGTCKVVALPCDEDPLILDLKAEALERHVVEPAVRGPDTRRVVGCGRPGRDVRIEIVDPETCLRRPPLRVGEIWISSHGVARAYWNQTLATEERLQARLADGDPARFLRTGDLGFLHEGQLFITGRIKDMIIIRGTNHYPQDIESTVQDAHPSIRAGCVAAFAYEVDGEERVGIVAEVERRQKDAWAPPTDRRCQEATPRLPPAPFPFDPEEVMASIMRAVAELHGIRVDRVALIQAGSIPKTTSGKIQRQASKMALLSGRIQPITRESEERRLKEEAARNELRERITDIIAETASIPRERLHARSSLHAYGIDSLTGVNIAYEIGLLLGQDVPSWLLSEQDTIEKIVAYAISRGGAR